MSGLNCEVSCRNFNQEQRLQGQAVRNFHVLRSDIAKRGAAHSCKARSFVSRGSSSSVRHSDECRQRIMETVATDNECRTRTFLDKNAPGEASARS